MAQAEDGAVLVNQIEPVWKLTDLNGHEVGSAELKGKVVILDFWATWCVPCIGEIPGYIELQKKYGPQGLRDRRQFPLTRKSRSMLRNSSRRRE